MPLTREERCVIEEVINRVAKLDERIAILEADVATLLEFSSQLKESGNFLDFSDDEIKDFIRESVRDLIKELAVKKHTHQTDEEGGPAFAQKGANLINGEE